VGQQIADRHNPSRQLKVNEDGSIDTNAVIIDSDGNTILSAFNTNDIEEASTTITYIGSENQTGAWYIKKIDTTSGNVFSHATVTNNAAYTTYDTAWAARASLVYANYGDVF